MPKDDRTLDSLPWRAAEAMQRIGEAARRKTRRLRRRPAVDALRFAVERGGYETARALAKSIRPQLGEIGGRREALPLVVETLLAHGERAEAAAVAAEHRTMLERTASGVALLAVLGDEVALRRWVLPGGRLHAYALSRAVEEGRIGGDEVLELLLSHRHALLQRPDVHLLVHAAWRRSDPERALAALNRCLRAYGLPKCAGDARDPLRGLRFDDRPARNGPLVSILVAAYRAADTVELAVGSLLAQTWRNLEVLVCDDGGGDDTLDVLRRRWGGDPRVRLFGSTRNQGPYNVRNQLLERARGDFVTFHDADDLALPTRIEAQVRCLRRGTLACYACFVRVTPDGRFVFFRDQSAVRLCRVTLMARRETLGTAPFRSVRFGADFELHESLRAGFGDAKIAVVRTPLVFGLWSPTSETRRPGAESHEDGYRSPARRAYSEWVFRRFRQRDVDVLDGEVARVVEESGNAIAATSIEEIAARAIEGS